MKLTLLIDGNNMAYRAKYAYDLSPCGKDVSVVYGSVRMLQALVKRYKPESVIYCWDGGTPDFRRRLVPGYKAHRKHKDDPTYPEFILQLQELQDILPHFGVLSVFRRGMEADDLLYHASRLLVGDSMIVTSDDDLLQAVSERTCVLKPGGKRDDVVYTLDNMDIDPQHFAEWKALQGDSSDNILGIAGVGPKTATKIINGKAVSDRVNERLSQFCESGAYWAALDCIDLSFDWTGARYILLNTEYIPFDKVKCTRWAIQWGFVSLIESYPLGMVFGKLKKPTFDAGELVTPRIWDYKRFPDEEKE